MVFSPVYRPEGLNSTLLSQGCILEKGSGCGKCGQNIDSNDRGGGEEPPIAWFQLMGQPAVTSSQ